MLYSCYTKDKIYLAYLLECTNQEINIKYFKRREKDRRGGREREGNEFKFYCKILVIATN